MQTINPDAGVASGSAFEATPIVNDNAGTTKFDSDTVGNSVERVYLTDINPSLWRSLDQDGAKDIKDFLLKPTLLAGGQLTTTDSGNFQVRPMPEYLLNNARIAAKLAGVAMIRCDIVFTLQVNAQRFQQGRYILAWLPTGGISATSSGAAAWYRAHAVNTTTVTQLPHVEIDLATQTTAILRVPYSSIFPYAAISTSTAGQTTLGWSFLRPYSPLQAGSGTNSCSYMLFAHLENVELAGNIMPQSGRVKFRSAHSIVSREVEDSTPGSISAILGVLSRGTGIMASVPVLGPIMRNVSWTTDYLAQGAKYFGFSKPIVLDKPTRVGRVSFPYSATADGPTLAQPLSLLTDNEVPLHDGVARTALDEMSIDFIKQQYAYMMTFSWSVTDNVGTIFPFEHNPSAYITNLGVNGSVPTPIALLSFYFKFWRGGMKFKFKFVKTEFHSGRLIFAYAPYIRGLNPNPSIDTSTFLVREIVDIRTTSEVEFCVPYVNPDLYLPFGFDNANPLENTAGTLYVIVGDALVAPDTVSDSIPIILEVCGAPDFEVSVPVAASMTPMIPFATQSGTLRDLSVPRATRFQSQAGYVKHECVILGSDSQDMSASAIAIGEKPTSFRQLIKRVNPFNLSGSPNPIIGGSGQTINFRPFVVNPVFETVSSGGTLVPDTYNCDLIASLAMFYVYNNGGVRYFCPRANGNTATIISTTLDHTSDPNAVVTSAAALVGSNFSRTGPYQIWTATDDVLNVAVPSYSRTMGRATAGQIVSAVSLMSAPTTMAQGQNQLQFLIAPRENAHIVSMRVYRYVSDDFSMSGWIGTVPMIPTIF